MKYIGLAFTESVKGPTVGLETVLSAVKSETPAPMRPVCEDPTAFTTRHKYLRSQPDTGFYLLSLTAHELHLQVHLIFEVQGWERYVCLISTLGKQGKLFKCGGHRAGTHRKQHIHVERMK